MTGPSCSSQAVVGWIESNTHLPSKDYIMKYLVDRPLIQIFLSDNMANHEINLWEHDIQEVSAQNFLKPTKTFGNLFSEANVSWKRLNRFW